MTYLNIYALDGKILHQGLCWLYAPWTSLLIFAITKFLSFIIFFILDEKEHTEYLVKSHIVLQITKIDKLNIKDGSIRITGILISQLRIIHSEKRHLAIICK